MKPSQKLKVAMVCAEYPPKSGPGPTRMAAFVKGLTERGHELFVFTIERGVGSIAARWRMLTDPLHSKDRTIGKIGGRGATQTAIEKIINLFIPMEPVITLSLGNLCRVFSRFASSEKPDVIFTTSNPLASSVGGVLLKRRHNIPLVVEFRDPWTQNPSRNWPTYLHYAAESLLERWVLRNADAVIMNTPTARANLLNKYKWVDEDKVHAISHGFDGEIAACPTGPKDLKNDEVQQSVHIGYAGGFYEPVRKSVSSRKPWRTFDWILDRIKTRISFSVSVDSGRQLGSSPEIILRAIALCKETDETKTLKVLIDFIGAEPKQLNPHIGSLGLEHEARILPRVPAKEIRQKLQSYDLLYLTNPSVTTSPFIGTKTFDYLAAGRPIIADLSKGDQANLIIRAKAGWVVRCGNHYSVYRLIKGLLSKNGNLLEKYTPDQDYINLFARCHQIRDLENIFEQATGQKSSQAIVSEGYQQLKSSSTFKYHV